MIKEYNNFYNSTISEHLAYHIENNISIINNIFRPGSTKFYELIKEARNHIELLSNEDKEIFTETDLGLYGIHNGSTVPLDIPILEKKTPELNKPTRSNGPKKYKVYVKNPKTGKIIKVNFGDKKGGLKAKINDPKARKSFVARHDCKNKKDKTKASYWSCRLPKFKNLVNTDYNGYW